ncbi:MAG: hypothetical protein Hyperionvirus13_46 [Hyperionvirus sp.]|uniref:Uncharacterized protein n=1 Tax=Hyperionvirus sp. TaxID=2487770 RepID=A0A3G5ADD4_9VIRU|nr:MAG: hypothetical protein Hyperionvirus13_46 [Hyperionvirus sp.]
MTCFWRGIIIALGPMRIENVLGYKLAKRKKKKSTYVPDGFVKALMTAGKGVLANDVLFNGAAISEQEKKEYATWIDTYDSTDIENGHLTGLCDPFLLLICQLFQINIEHKAKDGLRTYTNTKAPPKSLIKFKSTKNHFQAS